MSERKVTIITGGSRGIGAAMVDKLGELNYNIVINYNSDHSKAKAQEVADAVSEKYGVETFLVQANVADFDSCQHLVDEAVQHFGDKIEALVNNAGVTNNSNWVDVDHHAYEKLIGVNLMSAHLVLPYMVNHADKDHQCNIVSTSSVGGADRGDQPSRLLCLQIRDHRFDPGLSPRIY
ncbi:SDR family NAD(P)-dependent oxidoreductase [Limosilactobacillus fermentum]|uniref:SDR family NAD(P)-dependent oxidoreductase n=1 Tax=Limosilactobacillus fermentum TaxID=1613 RepID=UPI00237BBDFC|nr:SDR family NAD(P)-dependent oxidoreductase [Limosilactobacillus fermentum]